MFCFTIVSFLSNRSHMHHLSPLDFSLSVPPSVSQKPGMDLADTYITFVRQNQDILRDRVNDEMYTEKIFDVSASADTYTRSGISSG